MTRTRVSVMAAALCAVTACAFDSDSIDDEAAALVADVDAAPPACDALLTIAVTPAEVPPTRAGVPVALDIAVGNPNPAGCAPVSFVLGADDNGLVLDPRPLRPGAPPAIHSVAAGATEHLAISATIPASADGGDVLGVAFELLEPPPPPGNPPGPLPIPPPSVTAPPVLIPVAVEPGCQVSTAKELMIIDPSVVDDAVRTSFDPTSRDPRNGAWTFQRLVEHAARHPADAPAMVEAMLRSFTTAQTINGFVVAARPGMATQVLDRWPRTADGALDLSKAPLRLLAIVTRIDLRNLDDGDAGEGRFVFAIEGIDAQPGAPPPDATVIFEYKLPAARPRDVKRWAEDIHQLGRLPFGERYNAALQAITDRLVRRGARPGAVNGSALHAVRTNEIPLGADGLWELREFRLSRRTGRLEPTPLELTPDIGLEDTAALADYVVASQDAIRADQHVVPLTWAGAPFQAGAIVNDLGTWLVDGVDSEVRHHFAINTCNGCHALQETGTPFLHLAPRRVGEASQRSRWLTGVVVDDPVTGEPRQFDDLGRRKADLRAIVCRGPRALDADDQLRRGIRRVH
jgi:hypothetical protein